MIYWQDICIVVGLGVFTALVMAGTLWLFVYLDRRKNIQ